ncbi:MAG: dihydrofolate reductase [Bacteroidales bacterium]|nr:dihydrofolate reductase [Bacteroidales bacterium]
MISMIVAIDRNNAIGRGGDQLAYISADLKHFKAVTSGHTIVMGRKTSNALPKGTLPNRRNIVVSRNADCHIEGAEIVHSVDEAIEITRNDDVYVIGGGEVYRQFMPKAERLYVTEIDEQFEDADTFFPTIDMQEWLLIEEGEWQTDEKSGLQFRFKTLIRK